MASRGCGHVRRKQLPRSDCRAASKLVSPRLSNALDVFKSLKMDKETSLKLIKMYAANQLLWDSRHEDHYKRAKRDEIWDQIAKGIGAPKHELIAKMRSLQGSYRKEKNRAKKQIAKSRPYKSKWFAYNAFSFMRDRDPLATEDSLDLQELHPNKFYLNLPRIEDLDETSDENGDNSEKYDETKTHNAPAPIVRNLKRTQPHAPDDEVSNDSAPIPDKIARDSSTNDPYISFGLYIASELRKYDSHTVAHVKHAINNVIFQADTKFYNGTNSENCPNCSNGKSCMEKDTKMQQFKVEINDENME